MTDRVPKSKTDATEADAPERGSAEPGRPGVTHPGRGAAPSPAARISGLEVKINRRDMLRWVYLSRAGLAGGLFAAAVLAWSQASPSQTLVATLVLVLTLIVTPVSFLFSHVRDGPIGTSFVYLQLLYDTALVTTVVHLTGGSESVLPPVYILLIAAYTLMLPLRGGVLAGGLACIAYVADVVWGQGVDVDIGIALQLGLFILLAIVVAAIGAKFRERTAELSSKEEELEQLRLETSDILGNIPSAVMTVDAAGRLAYANPAAEELLDLDGEEWLDRPVEEELGKRSPDLRRVLEHARKHGAAVTSAEIELYRNGESVPVGISTAVVERRNGPPSVTAIMRDISDMKRLEELRGRTERLEAVAELSASLAHEIKNPLASISSSVQQLELREDADEDDRLLAELVMRESDRLSRLLAEFIDFGRVRIGERRELDLREVVRHAVEMVRQHPAYGEGCSIEQVMPSEPVPVEGDEDLLHRVVSNLLLNAIQAADAGSETRIVIEVRRGQGRIVPHRLDLLNPAVLEVHDDGPGIPPEKLDRIFDPFLSGRRGGSGLGLAIVHRAVEEHDGTVFVESNSDGTRFTVYLPGAPASASR